MNTRLMVLLTSLLFLVTCASRPTSDDHSQMSVELNDESVISTIEATAESGTAPYSFQSRTGVAQWITCKGKKAPESSVLVMHRFQAGFDTNSFCKGWIAQTFLKRGYQILAVNRPSYGETTGADDLAGPKSIAAVRAGVEAAKSAPIEGIWGYGTGTIAAAFYAKQFSPGLKWLMLGGGVYDLESIARTTKDEDLKSRIAAVKAVEGEAAFESRSIAWDFDGLPKLIGLYHAKDDVFSPSSQAHTFNDQLRVAEYKVYLNEIKDGGHDIPWRAHIKIIEQTLAQLVGKPE